MGEEYPKVNFTIVNGGVIISILLNPTFSMSQSVGDEAISNFVQMWIKGKLTPPQRAESEDSEDEDE